MQSKNNNYISKLFSTSENLLRFFDSHCEALLFVNEKGQIRYFNEAARNIFEYSGMELKNKNLLGLLADEDNLNDVSDFLKNGENRKKNITLNFRKQKKSVFSADVYFNSVLTGNGKTICCTIMQKEKENNEIEKLRQEKADALKLAQTKTEYIAQISHEIRSPLNLMLNFTSLIREVLETETRKALKEEFAIINNAGKRIIRTVDLVLNMSEIQSGNFEICKTKFDLYNEIILRIGQDFKNYAKEKKIKFTVKNTSDNSIIFADEYSVFQAVINVVDNSFKYTEKGAVELKLGRNRKGQLYVTVSDTGIGMSEEYQKDLFKPFHQEDNGFVGKIKGNGLGLSLVKKYCELNDMKIEVDSKKNVGTKIKLTFPK